MIKHFCLEVLFYGLSFGAIVRLLLRRTLLRFVRYAASIEVEVGLPTIATGKSENDVPDNGLRFFAALADVGYFSVSRNEHHKEL